MPTMFRVHKLLILFIIISTSLLSQNVLLDFDGNLEDASGAFTPNGIGDIDFIKEDDREFCRLGPESEITFPSELSEMAFGLNSFEVRFDFRVLNDDPIYADCCWGGFTLFGAAENLPLINIKMVNFPGFGPEWTYDLYDGLDGYVGGPYIIEDQEIESWRTIELRFDIGKKRWQTKLDDLQFNGAFPEDFDFQNFRDLLSSDQIKIKGINQSDLNVFIDIDNFEINAPLSVDEDALNAAFTSLTSEMLGETELSESEKSQLTQEIIGSLYYADFENIDNALFEYTGTYENLNPPLYQDGIDLTFEALPLNDQVLQFSQAYVFETQFVDGNIENVAGIKFEHHEVIPGKVSESAVVVPEAIVNLDGTYNRDVAAELTDQEFVVRPTGYFLPAGDIVTITLPSSAINSGLSIVVGAQFRNMDYDYLTVVNRFPDISSEFEVNKTEIKVANPFGGGIYLKVPEGSNVGIVEMKIENAIASPYFSWKEGSKTDVNDWLEQVANSGAPWADFESDKFMFTVPTDKLANLDNPDEIMTKWDEIMDAIRYVAGRPDARPRAEYYSFDTRLVTPAYGSGYPIVIPINEAFREGDDTWNPLKVIETRPGPILLHEMGHNHLQPTMAYGGELDPCHFLEAESIVHMLATSIYSNVYGMSVNDAFMESGVGQQFGFYQSAFDWIITYNFRTNERMYEDEDAPLEESEMLRYQPRSWAKYAEIAQLFGWDALSSVNGQFYEPGVEQTSNVCDWRGFVVGRDDYIKAATEALGVNMTPLFHFWGINPSPELAEELQVYPQSPEIKERILEYRENVAPRTLEDYMVYHDLFPMDDYQYPRYEKYLTEFDEEFAADILGQFDYLIETYFPALRTGSEIESFDILDVNSTVLIDTAIHEINVSVDADTDISNLVPTFVLSPGARASIQGEFQQSSVSVVDFSNPIVYEVTSEDQMNITEWTVIVAPETSSSIADEVSDVVRISPNPFHESIQISFGDLPPSSLEVYDIKGHLKLQLKDLNKETIRLEIPGTSGIYLLRLKWKDKSRFYKMVKQ